MTEPGAGDEPAPDLQPTATGGAPESAPASTNTPRRAPWAWLWIAFVVAVLAAAVWLLAPLATSVVQRGATALAELDAVAARVADLAVRQQALAAAQEDFRAAITAAQAGLGAVQAATDAAAAGAAAARAAAAAATTPEDLRAVADAFESRIADLARALSDLGARVDAAASDEAVVARIAELEAAGAGGVDAAPLDELRRRLAAAESAITDLRRAPPVEVAAAAEVAAAEARLNRALRAAEDRIAELETAMAAATAGGAGARGAVVLAVGQLQSRLRTSGEFTAALAAARAVAGDVADPELHALLADLQPHAGGVATLDELARSFAAIAGAVAVTEDAGEGWVAELWGRVRGAVSIRRTGEVPGDDPEARVARAEARLQQHDLAAAVAELDGLEIEAPELAPWLADARARLAADSVVERLGARALAVVAGSGAP